MDISVSALLKRILALIMPMLGSRIFSMLGSFFGMIMVAQLGHDELAASALIASAQITPFVILMAILFAIGVVVSQDFGAKHYRKIGAIMQQGCLLGLVLSIALALVYRHMGSLLLLLGQKSQLVFYINQYFHLLAWFAPILILNVCLSQFFYGVLRQRVVLLSNVIGFVAYVPTAYFFIFGHAGFPKLGMAGMALALIAQGAIQLIYLLMVLFFDKRLDQYALFSRHDHAGLSHLKKLFQIGWPMCIQFGGELLGWFFVSIMIGWLGERNLAAFQVVQQFMVLAFVSIFSIAEAGGIMVGHEVGAKAYSQLRQVGRLTLLLAAAILLFVMLLFILIPEQLASLYMNIHDPALMQTLHLVVWLFLLNAFVLFLDAERNILSGLLRGLFDTRYAMGVGIIFIWLITLPIGYVFAFYAHLQVLGFSVAYCFSFACCCLLLYRHWSKRIRCYERLQHIPQSGSID
jgi:multidrug resistance protein, MATE family